MQSVSSKIWTHVAVSYDNNHCTTGTSNAFMSFLVYSKFSVQSAGAVEYTDCISAEE